MKALTVNETQCLKQHLTLPQMLIALAIRESNLNTELGNLLSREVIVLDNGKYSVTQPWSDILDDIICNSTDPTDEAHLLDLAKKLRQCFPEGKMPGTPYYYRGNNREIALKLKKFFLQYGKYSDDEIIDATKRFVASFQGNYRYMQLAKYFISKAKKVTDEDGTMHVQEVSELATYLENKGEDLENDTLDWTMNSRN